MGEGMEGQGPTMLAKATALPARYDRGIEALVLDHRAVIARSWLLVAHQGLLAAPGDHVVEQVGAPTRLPSSSVSSPSQFQSKLVPPALE